MLWTKQNVEYKIFVKTKVGVYFNKKASIWVVKNLLHASYSNCTMLRVIVHITPPSLGENKTDEG